LRFVKLFARRAPTNLFHVRVHGMTERRSARAGRPGRKRLYLTPCAARVKGKPIPPGTI
jgi:hypothetical protein